jgi:hypothetical protein
MLLVWARIQYNLKYNINIISLRTCERISHGCSSRQLPARSPFLKGPPVAVQSFLRPNTVEYARPQFVRGTQHRTEYRPNRCSRWPRWHNPLSMPWIHLVHLTFLSFPHLQLQKLPALLPRAATSHDVPEALPLGHTRRRAAPHLAIHGFSPDTSSNMSPVRARHACHDITAD